jgi:hypothetical protein
MSWGDSGQYDHEGELPKGRLIVKEKSVPINLGSFKTFKPFNRVAPFKSFN